MEILGYYLDCDDAVCADCVTEAELREDDRVDPENLPNPIFDYSESDTPTHCIRCEALIAHALTGDGYDYVREAVRDFFLVKRGRREILAQWVAQYGREIFRD
jgi:hypothetical protein